MPSTPRQKAPEQLSPAKRRIFAAITIASPVLLVLVLEASLRLFHYGPDLSLFTTVHVAGQRYAVMNPDVGRRYFSRTEFAPASSADCFHVPKPAGTYRIFCLGGSTTVGYPYWFNGAFSTFLRDRLEALFPDRSIEIVNLGLTATNSFTVLDFARDLEHADADLLIVYDGHNEFYGALGVASRESAGGSRFLTNLSLRLLRFRVFQLLRDLYARIAETISPAHSSDDRGTMMERLARGKYIPLSGALYREGLDAFRANLSSLGRLCSERGTPLLLSTQVSNIRTLYPFISTPRPGMSMQDQLQFQMAFNKGRSAFLDGRIDTALARFHEADTFDSLRADVTYEIGRCLDSLGRKEDARRAYVRARDLDQLRFRTSSDFNAAIRGMDGQSTVTVVDVERWFEGLSPDSIVGRDLIFEHLHPTARGYFLMARAYARAMRERGLLASPQEWARCDTLKEDRLWNERRLTDLDEVIARRKIEILTSGWPFKDQVPTVSAISRHDTLGQIAETVTRGRATWYEAHEEATAYYRMRRDTLNMEREYRAIISQSPLNVQPRLKLARLYLDQGRLDEMRGELLASLSATPTILAYRALGDLALRRGKPAEAVNDYRAISGFTQSPDERLENGFLLGLAYARAGMLDSATAQLRGVLAIRADYAPARNLLQSLPQPH